MYKNINIKKIKIGDVLYDLTFEEMNIIFKKLVEMNPNKKLFYSVCKNEFHILGEI